MDLKDFVRISLVQIAQGIQEASEELKDTNAFINPKNVYVNAENRQNYGRLMQDKNFHPVVELVEFDIAVFAEKKSDSKDKISVSVGSVEIGDGGTSHTSSGSESRIKFKIPTVFPTETKKIPIGNDQ